MVELKNKYQTGIRRFGINWVGIYSLYLKETLRFLTVFGQTIIGPVVTAILFLLVISLAIGDFIVKILMSMLMLIPFRMLLKKTIPSDVQLSVRLY